MGNSIRLGHQQTDVIYGGDLYGDGNYASGVVIGPSAMRETNEKAKVFKS